MSLRFCRRTYQPLTLSVFCTCFLDAVLGPLSFTFTVRGELQRGNKNTTAVIHFEKLKADPEGAMRGVLGFMGFDPASAACIQPELSPLAAEAKRQQVHRPKPKDYPECVYTPEQINYISSKMWSLLSEHG